jgi:hypothetical protein
MGLEVELILKEGSNERNMKDKKNSREELTFPQFAVNCSQLAL